MTKKALLVLAATAICTVATLPLAAQTVALTANIPFPYNVGATAVPAGEYMISRDGTGSVIILRDFTGNAAATLVMKSGLAATDPARDTRLVFNRYGDRYFLSEVVDANAGTALVLPQTVAERELAKTASLQRENIIAVLARR